MILFHSYSSSIASLALITSFSWLSNFEATAWVSNTNLPTRQCITIQPTTSTTTNTATTTTTTTTTLYSVGKGKNAQQRKIEDFLDVIEAPVADGRLPVDPEDTDNLPPNLDPLAPFVETIVKAADMRKATEIRAIRVSKLTATTSFIVVVSGSSRPQNQAIAAAIQDEVSLFEEGLRTKGNGVPEGDANSGWILLDYGDVMVHIMTPKSRLFYDIEGRWEKGEDMDLSNLLVPNAPPDTDKFIGGMTHLEQEDDPFWS